MSPAIQVSEKINCCEPAEYKEPLLSPHVPKGLGTCEVGRDDLWKYSSVVFVLGKGHQCAAGIFPILPKSEELSVKGHCKIITKSRSCLGNGQSKQAGLLIVSSLPGVPAARHGCGTAAEKRACGMCITERARPSRGESLAQHRFARTVTRWLLLFMYFFPFSETRQAA